MKSIFTVVARFAEAIGLGLFVNALYSFQTSGESSTFIIMAESALIILTSILCSVMIGRK